MKADISILLPTRGRTESLKRSVMSLVDTAKDPSSFEILLAFDDDDANTSQWFVDKVVPSLNIKNIRYEIYEWPRLGYIRLNEYVNGLAKYSHGRWLMFWNDDAVMETEGWDQIVIDSSTDFRILRIPTHNHHPYAIFPIVPREWYDLFGYISPHQISDAWVSQMAYILDIMLTIPVSVTHDRFDLTGNNNDETYQERIMLEGNSSDPRDFNHIDWRKKRFSDCSTLGQYLYNKGQDMTWFKNVCDGKQDPWEKMTSAEFDPNQQIGRFS